MSLDPTLPPPTPTPRGSRDRAGTLRSNGLSPSQQGQGYADGEGEPPLPPGMMVGEYRIGDRIGLGGMSEVYGAVHPIIGKRAAVKVIASHLCRDPGAVGRFVQEARAANEIRHPNIVDIFSIGALPDGRSYLVMELLEGESLAHRIETRPLAFGEALDILAEIVNAIDAAHGKGIIHRDLKPDNVFLTVGPGGARQIKLLDFGIAKLHRPDGEGGQVSATATGMMLGTPMYMPPEQCRGHSVGPSADVYALGGMAYHMLVGRPPFLADNAADLITAHLTEPPPPPSRWWPVVPPELDQLLLDMLGKEAASRPSLAQVHERLRAIPRQLATVGPPRPPAHSALMTVAAPTTRRRRARAWLLGLGAALVAGVAVSYAISAGTEANPAAAALGPGSAKPTQPQLTPAVAAQPGPAAPPTAQGPSAPVARGGRLAVQIAAEGARVEIDREWFPVIDGSAEVSFANDGRHRVSIEALGHVPFQTDIEVAGGVTVRLPVQLLPSPQSDPAALAARRPVSGSHRKRVRAPRESDRPARAVAEPAQVGRTARDTDEHTPPGATPSRPSIGPSSGPSSEGKTAGDPKRPTAVPASQAAKKSPRDVDAPIQDPFATKSRQPR